MSIECGNWFQGVPSPVFICHIRHAIYDPLGAHLVREEVIHQPGPPAHLLKRPLQDVGRPNLLVGEELRRVAEQILFDLKGNSIAVPRNPSVLLR